jgi:nucleolar protein 15
MAPANGVTSSPEKEKKSKRKSLGDVTTAPIEVEEVVIVDDASPSKAERKSKNAKKKLARKAGKVGEAGKADSQVEIVKEKGKKSEKVVEEVVEPGAEEAAVKPKKATKGGKEKSGLEKSEAEKPTEVNKGKSVADKKDDDEMDATSIRSKSKKTQPISTPIEETVAEAKAESKKKTQKSKKEVAVVEKIADIPEPTTVSSETASGKIAGKKVKKTKDTKTLLAPLATLEATPVSTPLNPTPSTILTAQPSKKTRKPKAKEPSPEPKLPTLSDDEAIEADAELDSDDDDVHLHGFSTDDDDSSDEEDDMDFEPSAFDIGKLPTIAKDDATVKRKLDKAKSQPVCLHDFIRSTPGLVVNPQLLSD